MSSTNGLKVVVFLSSVRPNRMAERVGKSLKEALVGQNIEPVMFDPLEMMFEVVQLPIHFMANPDEAPIWLKEANEKIKTADAFLIASGEYNSSIPPALTNMMDHFPTTSYRNRPVGILTYSIGDFGGIRAAMHLRTFVVELGMFPVPKEVIIANVQFSINEAGAVTNDRVKKHILKQIDQIRWLATAIKNHVAIEPPPV